MADLERMGMGAAAWRAHVEDCIRAAFRALCENHGNKAVAGVVGTSASAITMAYNGERPIPIGWLVGIRTLDRDNAIGTLLARLIYDADLRPIPKRTPEQERDLLVAELRRMGDPGEAAIRKVLG